MVGMISRLADQDQSPVDMEWCPVLHLSGCFALMPKIVKTHS